VVTTFVIYNGVCDYIVYDYLDLEDLVQVGVRVISWLVVVL
jgi:hypothetical protein